MHEVRDVPVPLLGRLRPSGPCSCQQTVLPGAHATAQSCIDAHEQAQTSRRCEMGGRLTGVSLSRMATYSSFLSRGCARAPRQEVERQLGEKCAAWSVGRSLGLMSRKLPLT
eukprot:4165962-Prymnesium_polylepis.1